MATHVINCMQRTWGDILHSVGHSGRLKWSWHVVLLCISGVVCIYASVNYKFVTQRRKIKLIPSELER